MLKQILSCDWGTSSFRLRLINITDSSIVAETKESKGIATVYNQWLESGLEENARPCFYKKVLLSQVEKLTKDSLAGVPVIISGMASSSIGITELPYTTIPFSISNGHLNIHRIPSDEKCQHEILIVSGLRTNNDAMRGEETILLGCEITENDEQLFIFPGTHSKHLIIQGNTLRDFKTYMTGELFDLLSTKSILAASVEEDAYISEDNRQQFIKGVHASISTNLLNNIFHVRTNRLFNQLTKKENYHYLSGLLIGEELKNIQKENYRFVTLVSTGTLSALYSEALSVIGLKNKLRHQNADKALIAGQTFILNRYRTIIKR